MSVFFYIARKEKEQNILETTSDFNKVFGL